MTDSNPLFSNLDDGSGNGVARAKVLEGDAAAAKNAAAGLVAKDNSGNLKYLETDSLGRLLVSQAAAGACVGGHFTKTAGATSRTQVGADVALTAGKALAELEWSVGCFRAAAFELVIVDDPGGADTETPIMDILVSEGDNTDSGKVECLDDISTAGMTGPVFRIYATNINKASDFRARATMKQEV